MVHLAFLASSSKKANVEKGMNVPFYTNDYGFLLLPTLSLHSRPCIGQHYFSIFAALAVGVTYLRSGPGAHISGIVVLYPHPPLQGFFTYLLFFYHELFVRASHLTSAALFVHSYSQRDFVASTHPSNGFVDAERILLCCSARFHQLTACLLPLSTPMWVTPSRICS